MLPKSKDDVQTIVTSLREHDLAFTIDLDTRYWVWRYKWHSESQDTVVLKRAEEEIEIVAFLVGAPAEPAVRRHLEDIAANDPS